MPGVGAARMPNQVLGTHEAKRLDIHLERGVTFRAKVVDSITLDPVPGVRLWHWQHPGVEGSPASRGAHGRPGTSCCSRRSCSPAPPRFSSP